MMPSAKLLNSRIFKGLSLLLPLTLAGAIASPTYPQAGPPRPLRARSAIQEADSQRGTGTARGDGRAHPPAPPRRHGTVNHPTPNPASCQPAATSKSTTQPAKYKQPQLKLNTSAVSAGSFSAEMFTSCSRATACAVKP